MEKDGVTGKNFKIKHFQNKFKTILINLNIQKEYMLMVQEVKHLKF